MHAIPALFPGPVKRYTEIQKRSRRWPMDESDNKVMTGALLVLAGAILGAGVALLVAPQSGKETRRDITKYARKTRRKVEGVAGEVAESVADLADMVEEKAEELLDKGKDLAKESRQAVLDALEEGQERIGRQRDRLAKLLG
jgi:gas vesicle protein